MSNFSPLSRVSAHNPQLQETLGQRDRQAQTTKHQDGALLMRTVRLPGDKAERLSADYE